MLLNNQKKCNATYKSESNSSRYFYKVYGFTIVSDIVLPELLPMEVTLETPEVSVRIGQVPSQINNAIEKNESYQAARHEFLMQVPGVGRYYVANGNSIIIEPERKAEKHLVRIYLLGTACGVLLFQRGVLPIHGSAVVIHDCGVVFTGLSGAGKSTLLAACRKNGYQYLSDDVAAVTVDKKGAAWIHAAYPQQKLWRDSAKAVGVDIASLTPFFVGNGKDKFSVPAHKGFYPLSIPLAVVYKIQPERRQEVVIQSLVGFDKLKVLMSQTYRLELLDGLGLTEMHFKLCASVARQVAVSQLIRPDGVFSMEEQILLIQQDVTRNLVAGAAG